MTAPSPNHPEAPPDDIRHFRCDLGNGVVCRLTFNLSAYSRSNGRDVAPQVTWTGYRTARMFPRYLQWIHSVNGIISEAINREHGYRIQNWTSQPPSWEVWRYWPNGERQRLLTGEGVLAGVSLHFGFA